MELEPGNTVELHGLGREDLNGTRGTCRAYDADKERWEVTTYGTTPKKLAVRPSNLKRVSSQRTEAMKALSTCLHERYPKKGFKFHPSLSFEVDEGGGVCIRTTANINMGEILIVVPSDVGVSTKYPAGVKLPNGTSMQQVLDDVAKRWETRNMNDPWAISCADLQLAVLLTHIVCCPDDQLLKLVAAALPSMEDARHGLPLLLTSERFSRMQGTKASRLIERTKDMIDASFKLVEPVLTPLSDFFCQEGESLRESFFYGFSLSYSRAHDSEDSDNGGSGVLHPLIDAINGLPGPHTAINVAIHLGKWPFLRGSIFRNDCNLSCSAVSASRDLHAGEELIIDYGELTTTSFVLKYGVCPRQLLPPYNNPTNSVEVILPSNLEPKQSDLLRLRAVKDIFGFDGFETGVGVELSMRDLNEVRRGGEPDNVKCLRQLCVLLIASDYDIKAFCDCNGSRFRFNLNTAILGQKLKECFDHCLNLLTPIKDEDVVRVIERQGLQAWRDVMLERYPSYY